MKEIEGKSCLNCIHGVTIPPFPYECSLMKDGKWVHEGGYCPEELICKNWEIDPVTGMEDTSEMWRSSPAIMVD